MSKVMGVQFQKNGKMYYFDANDIDAKNGQYVIVDTVRGYDLGEVVMEPREVPDTSENESLKKAVRLATEQDIQHSMDNRIKEREAFGICQKKISEHKLEMKLVSVEYPFDGSKVIFYFTANGRVDFRSLVKDLASVFKMRIELRQIGVRDEAKMLGGLGPCGRPICCGAFLTQFQPVSIKMAKEQNLSLNPTKISGVCGRLMCCLKYEQDHYEQTRKRMPKVGRTVATPDGIGSVTDLNIVKETVFVRLTNGDTSEIKEFPLELISKPEDNALAERVNNDKAAEGARKDRQPEKSFTKDEQNLSGKSKEKNNDEGTAKGKENSREARSARGKDNNRNAAKVKTQNTSEQLGQPVKRENPNRTHADNVTKTEKAEKTDKKGAASWAIAVEDAMRAIDIEQ